MRQLPQPRRAPVVACASDLLLTPADWSIDVEARRADHSVTSPTLPGSQLAQDLRHAPRCARAHPTSSHPSSLLLSPSN